MNQTTNMVNELLRQELLSTALKGGSNYWYHISSSSKADCLKFQRKEGESFADCLWNAVRSDHPLPIHSHFTGEKLGVLTLASIIKGEETMSTIYQHQWKAFEDENWDGETADVWFQCAVIGKLQFT